MERKLTTIVAMDVVGYSTLMESDEEGTLDRLKDVRGVIVDPAIARHLGRTVKLMGDGTLAEFASVVGALQCSVEIQDELSARNASVAPDRKIELRIGLHLGDVIVEENDLYGDGVNIASRLEGIAPAGGILLSKQVYDHIGNNTSVDFIALGEQKIKNISRPVEVFQVDFGTGPSKSDILSFGAFELDSSLFELRGNGVRIPVEPQVFNLLVYLAQNRDRTVTKEELFEEIWRGRIVSDAALSSQIKAARRVVGDDGASQSIIRTIHGRGFRFIARVQQGEPVGIFATADRAEVVRSVHVSPKPGVAVLPFINLNQDTIEDYFADGISEDIIISLSKNRWLTVVARNSSFAFRNTVGSVKAIGEQLAANYIVTGSVRKAGSRARVNAQVVDVETGECLWAERFDRDMADIFELQDEITELVSARIEGELGLTEQRKAKRLPKKNRGAWELYQLGVAEFNKFTRDANINCQNLLRQALVLDNDFASAHARLAYAIVLSMVYFDATPDDALLNEALQSAQNAIRLDDQDATGYFTIGRVHLARCEYQLAIEALQYALELNPCLAVSYCGLGDSLAYEGRLDEALDQFDAAIRLSPHDPFRWAFFAYRALCHMFRGEFDDAVLWSRKSVQVPNAQYWAKAHLVAALGHLGNTEEIEFAVKDLKQTKPEFTLKFAKKHLFYVKRADQLNIYMDGLKRAGIA